MRIALGWPLHSADRDRLRQLTPLPAIYPDSTARPCTACGMTLAVGPRLTAELAADDALLLMCPVCAVLDGPVATISHLGNPDSRIEP